MSPQNRPLRKKFSKKEREVIFLSQKEKCMYCGLKIDLAYMELDHKKPISRGGNNNISNLQVLCGPCNKIKGNLTDGEFRKIYKAAGLLPARQSKGPPARRIPRIKFDQIVSKKPKKLLASKKRKTTTASNYNEDEYEDEEYEDEEYEDEEEEVEYNFFNWFG